MRHLNRLLHTLPFILAGTLAATLAGCSPVVLPASQHAPVAPSSVLIYSKQPARYEALGTITVLVTPEMKWDERAESIPGFDALKAKAAAKGANGVLLVGQPGTFDALVTVGYHGTWYQVPMKREPRQAVAQAIFVIDE